MRKYSAQVSYMANMFLLSQKRPRNYRHIRDTYIIYLRSPSIMSSYLFWAEKRPKDVQFRCPELLISPTLLSKRNAALQLKDRGRYKRSSAFMPTGHNLFSVLRSWAEGLASPTEKRRTACTLSFCLHFISLQITTAGFKLPCSVGHENDLLFHHTAHIWPHLCKLYRIIDR